jgi:hypothetical protein
VFRNLALANDLVLVNACWVWSGVRWGQKPVAIPEKGDVLGFFDNYSNVAMLSPPILSCDAVQQICIRQSIPVAWCLDTKNVLDTQLFVPAIMVKNSKTTWELMDENDDEMEQLVWDGDEGVKNLFGIYIKQPDEAFLSFL